MTTRRIIILHGYNATPSSDWYGNVADHFRRQGCEVEVPALPFPWAPNLNLWSKTVRELLDRKGWNPDINLTLIAHSTGCLAALRFAEQLPAGTKLGPSILVAGFPAAMFHGRIPTLVARAPRPALLRGKFEQVLAVHSTNDWRVPCESNIRWAENTLGAEAYRVVNGGHLIRRHGYSDWPSPLYQRVEDFLGKPCQ